MLKRILALILVLGAQISWAAKKQVKLTWKDPDPTVVSYTLFRSSTCSQWVQIATKLPQSKQKTGKFKDTSVQGGMSYCYAVWAVDAQGRNSTLSAPLTVYVP